MDKNIGFTDIAHLHGRLIDYKNYQEYERYLPTAFDESLTMLEKINKLNEVINMIIKLANDLNMSYIELIENWEKVREYMLGEGLKKEVVKVLELMYEDGRLAEIINETIFQELNQKIEDYKTDLSERMDQLYVNAVEFGVKNDGTPTSKEVQELIIYCEENNKNAYFPAGTYLIEKTVYTRNQSSYYYTPGLILKGAGKNTIFKGNGANPVNYMSSLQEQALFNIHSNNMYISDVMFRECKCAVYFGKDKKTSGSSHSSFITMERIWMQQVGTGLILEPHVGIYYNKFRDFHISEFQIGVDMMETTLDIVEPNNNRNFFEGFRMTRGWIGFSVVGDGNTFIGCFGENITGNQAIGVRPTWNHLIHNDDRVDNKAVMWLMHEKASNNRIIGGSNEKCDVDVYDAGYKNHYISNRFDDFSTTPKVFFTDLVRTPGSYIGIATKIGYMESSLNSNSIFGTGAGNYIQNGRIQDKNYDRKLYPTNTDNIKGVETIHSQSVSRYSKLGRVLNWTLSVRFKKTGNGTDPVKIKLPNANSLSVEDTFLNQVLTGISMNVGGVTGGASDNPKYLTPLYAYFTRESDGDYLNVLPSENGWNIAANANVINFNLNIYTKEK